MENLPQDPFILLSYINTMLRDRYSSLDELCEDMDIDVDDLTARLAMIEVEYNPELNKFL